tara:strand:+ start:4722 stop:5198 length:477 start_codon:yes stop_codon:yes gene_type:complete
MEENKKPKLVKGKELLDKIPEDSFIKINKNSVIWTPISSNYMDQLDETISFILKDMSEEEQFKFFTKFKLSEVNPNEFNKQIKDGTLTISPAEMALAPLMELYHLVRFYAANQDDVEYQKVEAISENVAEYVNDTLNKEEEENEKTSSGPIVIQPSED